MAQTQPDYVFAQFDWLRAKFYTSIHPVSKNLSTTKN